MALELTIVKETHPAESFTIADGASVEKGTLMKMTDPNTVAASDGDADIIAGVLKIEKVANSGITQAAVWTRGDFKATAGGSITVGDALITNASTGVPFISVRFTSKIDISFTSEGELIIISDPLSNPIPTFLIFIDD